MRKITIVYDGSKYTFRWLKPLFWAKDEFYKLGYKVEFSSLLDWFPYGYQFLQTHGIGKIRAKIASEKKHDIVFLAFHHSTSNVGMMNSEERISLVKHFSKNSQKVCWLDTADSTGTCLFDVLPYVDIYFKKQALKNVNDYTRPIYGGRTFCEFYHKKLCIEDDQLSREYPVAKLEDLSKIRISWNVGFADLFDTNYYKIGHLGKLSTPAFQIPSKNKNLDIHYRGSGYSPIAGYQRSLSQKKVNELKTISHPDVTQKVPHDEYVQETRRAYSILSPFGWGEICTRDFEAFVYGAVLLKPSMEHCITWPDVYQPMKTYVPIDWNFENFEEIVQKVKSKEFQQIAAAGQDFYKKIRFNDLSKNIFATHVIEELEK